MKQKVKWAEEYIGRESPDPGVDSWLAGFEFAKLEMVKEIQSDKPICGSIMELGEQVVPMGTK